MIKYLVAAFFFLCSTAVFAQSSHLPGGLSPRYDVDDGIPTVGSYYAGVLAKGANMIHDWGLEVGARAGKLMLDERLGLGVGFYSLLTDNIKIQNADMSSPYALRLTYGGAEAEYSIAPTERLKLSVSGLVGMGKTSYSMTDKNQSVHTLPGEWFTIVEPALRLDVRLSKNLWIGPSLNYRQVYGVHNLNLHDGDFSKWGASLTLTSIIY